jgi:hypothetical protein
VNVRYLHPDKIQSVSKVLGAKKKKAVRKAPSDGLSMIERMARDIHAQRVKRGR